MLKRFTVENFKGFQNKLTFDLTARDYEFNQGLVHDGVVSKAIIYGPNGIGKSSLGIALFDIVAHLTDKQRIKTEYLANYRNLESNRKEIMFSYLFVFGDDEVLYEYAETDIDELTREKLTINGKIVIDYDFFDPAQQMVEKAWVGDLNIGLTDNKLSVVKYVYRNLPTGTIPVLTSMVQFCENMLWYRCLSDGNTYAGFTNGASSLYKMIYEKKALKEFRDFLFENGLNYDLDFEMKNDAPVLYAYFYNRKRKAEFFQLASTGTRALLLFFVWKIMSFDKISLLFIDEFDAFFHYQSAENIVKQLNKLESFQTFLTTHNTYLMQNRLTRPDCCFLMSLGKVTNLYDSTDKEIREAHNLEKMYIGGAFRE